MRSVFYEIERLGQYAMLELRVAWLAQWTTEWKVTEQSSRRGRAFDLRADGSQRHRGQSCGFEHMRKHTHGARTQRSNGGEQHHIHPIGEQQLGSLRTRVETHGGQLELVAGE